MGSLFDGAGMFVHAAEKLGIKTLWSSEIDESCELVTQERFSDVIQLGDITKINGAEIPPVDIIVGGSPCQDLSVAGARGGLAGERSSLFLDMIRIVREMREASGGTYPRYMFWENVPGALSSHKGADFNAVIEETVRLAQAGVTIPKPKKWRNAGSVVGDGYSVVWRILDSQYWGVPQRRRRLFLVLDFGGESAEEILFKPEGLSWYTAKGGESGQTVTDSTEDCTTGGCGWNTTLTFPIGGYADYTECDISSPLRACGGDIGGGSETLVVEELPVIYDMTHAQDVIREYGQIVPTLQARMGTGGNNVPLVLMENPAYIMATGHTNAEITTNLSPTLLGEAHEQPILFKHDSKLKRYIVRRLTPRETERLMGLPDSWTLVHNGKRMMSDTKRYKMVGNGVAVPCAMRVLSGIIEQLKGEREVEA